MSSIDKAVERSLDQMIAGTAPAHVWVRAGISSPEEYRRIYTECVRRLWKRGCGICGSHDQLKIAAMGSLAEITARCGDCDRKEYFEWLAYWDKEDPATAAQIRADEDHYIGPEVVGVSKSIDIDDELRREINASGRKTIEALNQEAAEGTIF